MQTADGKPVNRILQTPAEDLTVKETLLKKSVELYAMEKAYLTRYFNLNYIFILDTICTLFI